MKSLSTHFFEKNLLTLLVLILSHSLLGQGEAWNWYFGQNAGVSFSSGNPVALTDGVLNIEEGVASISNSSGQLLFYTDGMTIYNANHVPMLNGTGLLGDASSAQSGIIVKLPESDSIYYVFTVGSHHASSNGFRYSIVNMSLDNGLGEVTEKNILIRASVREKLTALKHANGVDYWILINDWVNDDIFAYHLTPSGFNTTYIPSNMGPFHSGVSTRTLGYLRATRQNNRIALANWEGYSFILMDFNNSTGTCSNKITIQGTSSSLGRTYGVEFSPDGTRLYGSTLGPAPYKLLQFDLTLESGSSIFANRTTLATRSNYLSCSWGYYFGAIQIAPNGKIYVASDCETALHCINQPDSLGVACIYEPLAVSLEGKKSRLGLPNFVSDYILPICTTTTATDTQVACDYYTWIDGNTYSESNNTATYTLENVAGCDSIVTLNLTINPVDVTLTNTSSTATANQSGASYQWVDCDHGNATISDQTNQSFTPTTNGNYAVEVTYNGCSGISDCVLMLPVGISEENDKTDFTVFPNPSNGLFTIETNEQGTNQYHVYDATGKLTLSGTNTSPRFSIDISHLPDGMYLLKMNDTTKVLSKMK